MRVATEISAPRIEVQSAPECYTLQASLELDSCRLTCPQLKRRRWRLGLAAVIEETSGRKSYWALAHPPGKPDFHHSDCFALEFLADSVATMKFGIDRLLAEPALRAPLNGRRVALLAHPASVTARPDAFARCAGRMRRHQARRRFRAAAWPARRQAGQHDRVAGFQRSGARHSGLQPVWRSAQADRCDDGYLRCHPRRSAGFGLPHLYVHHDAALHARSGGETSAKRCGCWIGPIRSAGRSKA